MPVIAISKYIEVSPKRKGSSEKMKDCILKFHRIYVTFEIWSIYKILVTKSSY